MTNVRGTGWSKVFHKSNEFNQEVCFPFLNILTINSLVVSMETGSLVRCYWGAGWTIKRDAPNYWKTPKWWCPFWYDWDHRFKKDIGIQQHFGNMLKSTWCEGSKDLQLLGQTRAFSEPLPSRDLNLRVTLQSGWARHSVPHHLFAP